MRYRIAFGLLAGLLLAAGAAVIAQPDPTPTPAAGAARVAPVVPVPTATLVPEDARLAVCTGPTLDGFVPHIVRPGETLADLLRGVPNVSVSQLAALNCVDDPAALPVGAVVWVPAPPPPDSAPAPKPAAARIVRLTVSQREVPNQSPVTFSWEADGEQAFFYPCPGDPALPCDRPLTATPVPLVHSVVEAGGFQYAGPARFRLEVLSGDTVVTEDVTLTVVCSQQPLGRFNGFTACPSDPPTAVFAAWQPFEGGVMMWFFDTKEIWVMTNADHRVTVYPDTYVEGMADPALAAPTGLFTPVRGFGRVWEALGGPASALGWALAPETGFDSARQAASRRSFTTYIKGPGDTVYAVTQIPQLGIGLWAQVNG
ncbi:MAG: LysM peptidoglycan-binding domain-containing protein [Aggregatilineales bacterium]